MSFRTFLGSSPRLGAKLLVLDRMLRRLRDDAAEGIVATTAGPTRDLFEVANRQDFSVLPVVLAELREEHRSDRHIHPDAQCVRPADQAELSLLREPLNQSPVTGAASPRGAPRSRDAETSSVPYRRACRIAYGSALP